MKIVDIIEKIERYAPIEGTLNGEKNGIILGDKYAEVNAVMVVFSLKEDVVTKAIEKGVNFIITYCPIDLGKNIFDKAVIELIKNDIAVYVCHSNLDVSENGFENILASKLGVKKAEIIETTFKEKCYKLVSCVPKLPEDYTSKIRKALGDMGVEDGPSGAGYIGTYSQVSDAMNGIQWFVTMPGANPFIGAIGELSAVEVERFEMIVPEHQLDAIIDKLCEVHPYEEVEYDVYTIMETRNHKGIGRVGTFADAKSVKEVVAELEDTFTNVRYTEVGDEVSIIAICGNVCSNIAEKIVALGADAVIISAINAEDADMLAANGISVIMVDNYELKTLAINKLADAIAETGVCVK